MLYQDFDLLIERTEAGFRALVLDSPGGEAVSEFRLPFSEDKLENFLLRLGRTRRPSRRVETPEMHAAKTFGAALFDAVFSGDVRACFHSSLDAARRDGAGLRVRLRLADPETVDLPWEFLYNSSVNRFLALSVQTPLVRYLDLPERIQPLLVSPPIRVLVMISSPTDYPSLDVEAEWSRLTDSLGPLRDSGHLAIDRLDAASLGALQRRLRKSQYHIFHFIGHGEFDRETQEGVLVLEDEQERGHRVGSQYLGMLLHDHESLRVAILNACEGARTSRSDPFAGSAQSLVQQGIPAVIAMQFEISDEVASTFAYEFYGAVADGYPIDAALTEARKAIFAAGRELEWGTPVLYLRAPDGRIFEVDRDGPSRPLSQSEGSGAHALETELPAGTGTAGVPDGGELAPGHERQPAPDPPQAAAGPEPSAPAASPTADRAPDAAPSTASAEAGDAQNVTVSVAARRVAVIVILALAAAVPLGPRVLSHWTSTRMDPPAAPSPTPMAPAPARPASPVESGGPSAAAPDPAAADAAGRGADRGQREGRNSLNDAIARAYADAARIIDQIPPTRSSPKDGGPADAGRGTHAQPPANRPNEAGPAGGRGEEHASPGPAESPAPAPAPASAPRAAPRATVAGAIDAYESAMTRGDRAALLEVYPSAPRAVVQALGQPLKNIKTYNMDIQYERIDHESESRARVDCTIFHTFVKFSGNPDFDAVKSRLVLERRGESWIVVDVKRR